MRLLFVAAAFAAVAFATPAQAQCRFDPNDYSKPPVCPAAREYYRPQQQQHTAPAQQVALPAKANLLQGYDLRRQKMWMKFEGMSPGHILIMRDERYLYLVLNEDEVMRYAIAVGRQGFGDKTTGEYYIGEKRENPWWYPPQEMQERDHLAAQYPNGMVPGPNNPLGKRALNLHNMSDKLPNPKNRLDLKAKQDSIFRIHGTNKPWTIGTDDSSGCFRMNNDDAIDLFDRVVASKDGQGATRVVVQ